LSVVSDLPTHHLRVLWCMRQCTVRLAGVVATASLARLALFVAVPWRMVLTRRIVSGATGAPGPCSIPACDFVFKPADRSLQSELNVSATVRQSSRLSGHFCCQAACVQLVARVIVCESTRPQYCSECGPAPEPRAEQCKSIISHNLEMAWHVCPRSSGVIVGV
jgi:hypothetical protein